MTVSSLRHRAWDPTAVLRIAGPHGPGSVALPRVHSVETVFYSHRPSYSLPEADACKRPHLMSQRWLRMHRQPRCSLRWLPPTVRRCSLRVSTFSPGYKHFGVSSTVSVTLRVGGDEFDGHKSYWLRDLVIHTYVADEQLHGSGVQYGLSWITWARSSRSKQRPLAPIEEPRGRMMEASLRCAFFFVWRCFVRVPTSDVSVVYLTVRLEKDVFALTSGHQQFVLLFRSNERPSAQRPSLW